MHLLLLLPLAARALVQGPWSDKTMDPSARAAALVANMTLDEKLAMLHGPDPKQCNISFSNCAYVGNIVANPRLGIPPVTMNDGPQGFRDNKNPGTTTSWPSGLTMAATWDTDAMMAWGTGMGKEFYAKGANVQLGPGLCLARVPRNGRNFEYLSGEDPFLGYTLVKPVIAGIQSQKVVANAKHYVMNNEETNRHGVSAEVDERTRFEMYYPPFRGAIEAGVGSIMCSYNKINGAWACENPTTLGKDLKQSLGFKGYVMSDWGATHSASIMAGLDVEMPHDKYMNTEAITAGIAAGNITTAKVDDAVTRILYAMFSVGVMDEPVSAWDWHKQHNNATTEASVQIARELSSASTVLLKNADNLLPLPLGKKIAVIGFGTAGAVVHGGGSGAVTPSYVVTPLEGIQAGAGEGATVVFDDGTTISTAVEAAKAADYAIVFVATMSHEGADRDSLSLDDGCVVGAKNGGTQCTGNNNKQNAMVEAIVAANPKTIVVASVPGAVLMPWSPVVPAVLVNFMPGQQAGHAIADVIFGKVNPSARLPITMPNRENETDFSPAQWPGLPAFNPAVNMPTFANYTEKLLVGYRYYDHHNIQFTSGFPFGHGLSYTAFEYFDLKVVHTASKAGSQTTTVTFGIKNTGTVAGAEVAQLYLGFPASAGEPPKNLRGFTKVMVAAGGFANVEMTLQGTDTSVWSVDTHSYQAVEGSFDVYVGASSRDIRLTGTMSL